MFVKKNVGIYMSLVMRKAVFGIYEQVRLEPVVLLQKLATVLKVWI